jgi:multidrug efflux pump subunit AcrA (membrane-fusion protein)
MSQAITEEADEVAVKQQALDSIHERLAAGDPKITPAKLAEAESDLRFAVAQRDARERAAVKRAAAERQAQLDQLRARLGEFSQQELDEALEAVRAAVGAYLTVAGRARDRLSDIRDELAPFATLPEVSQNTARDGVSGVRIGDVAVLQPRVQIALSGVLLPLLKQHTPRGRISLDNPPD